jgi:tRNA threonylcarbamoyl adenosine modification protein (Sua5/YciO/YrdC/YwlC family)
MADGLDDAAAVLESGGVVAIPTDTVYGLAADPSRPGATEAVFAVKGRPAAVDLPVLVACVEQADALAGTDGLPVAARRLAARFWPGALTLVVARRPAIDWRLGGSGDTIGLRCPDHDLARALCHRVGPLAVTSANRHGEAPLTSAAAVRAVFGDAVPVVDGGRCDRPPSTVVAVRPDGLHQLRAGALAWDEIVAAD